MSGIDRAAARSALDRLLDDFPVLASRGGQKAGSLSGGEQKMLVLCRALLRQPALLVLDEVTEGMQPSVVDRVAHVIERQRQASGTTVLLVEQNLEFALGAADRVLVLTGGQVSAESRRDEPDQVESVVRAMGL